MNICPIVSVCMITYNHEPYIAEAIEGVLMQQTTFPIELIISEDCSTDNTRKKIKEYADKYPDIIVADLPEKNRGMMKNFHHCMSQAQGKYIALCEGDDYWTDPLKLQKQVVFLEANLKYEMCFHNAIVHYESGNKCNHMFAKFETGEFTRHQLTEKWIASTASFVFRRSVIESDLYQRVQASKKIVYGDFPLIITASYCGKIYGMGNTMSIYRKHIGGIMNTYDAISLKILYHCLELRRIFGQDFKPLINKTIGKYSVIALSKMKHGEYYLGVQLFCLSIINAPIDSLYFVGLHFKQRKKSDT